MEKQTAHNHPRRIEGLIDAASDRAGGQNKLAKLIGYSKQEVSGWRTGTNTCPVEAQALMAHVAGLNAQEVLTHAVIEKHAGTERGARLETVLGKALLHTVAAAFFAITASGIWGSNAYAGITDTADTMRRKVKRGLRLCKV